MCHESNSIRADCLKNCLIFGEFGLGTFYNGYLKAIDPNEYIELVQQSYFDGEVTIDICDSIW